MPAQAMNLGSRYFRCAKNLPPSTFAAQAVDLNLPPSTFAAQAVDLNLSPSRLLRKRDLVGAAGFEPATSRM